MQLIVRSSHSGPVADCSGLAYGTPMLFGCRQECDNPCRDYHRHLQFPALLLTSLAMLRAHLWLL